ncbi:MAG TPA: hypothetical protein VFX02_05935 [Gammaproteobacteria bacterium]|nr:hypothetical protein [Gammaproteobacteria bacterium]
MKFRYSLVAGLIFSMLGMGAYNRLAGAVGSPVAFEDLPDHYLFLLFPNENTKFYATEKLTNALGVVNRAVTASKAELTKNRVGVIFGERQFYSKSTDFNFYIDDSVARDKYLGLWERALETQGYSSGHWRAKFIGGNSYSIELDMHDSKHARKDLYRYSIEGHKVLNTYPVRTLSGIEDAGIGVLSFFAGVLFLNFVSLLIRHRARRQSA